MRQPLSQLRRWCPESTLHQDPEDVECLSEHDDGTRRPGHRLRLRRMLVCSVCEQGYMVRADFDVHECFSAY